MKHIIGITAWRGVQVELDGQVVAGWWEADDEDGYVLVPVLGDDGVPLVDGDGNVVVDRREGDVAFVPVEVST